jgi:hypothetical protein
MVNRIVADRMGKRADDLRVNFTSEEKRSLG